MQQSDNRADKRAHCKEFSHFDDPPQRFYSTKRAALAGLAAVPVRQQRGARPEIPVRAPPETATIAREANNGLGSEGAMQKILNAVCLVVALCVSGAAAGQATLSPEEIAERQLLLQEDRLKLDRERFDHEKSMQENTAKKESAWTLDRTILAALLTAIAAYFTQMMIRRSDEKLQFQLKAAEIAMAGRDATQAVRRAKFLRALFSSRLAALDDVLEKDAKDWPHFGRSIEDRHDMLQMLAQYPGSREEIIRAWEIMFPWSSSTSQWSEMRKADKDAYRWFDELKADPVLNRNQARPA